MRFFERSHIYESDFDTVTSAWFVKYPNPQTQHVKEIHTIDRTLSNEGESQSFSLRRLFYLEFGLPQWIQRLMKKKMEGYAMEEVTCSLHPKMLRAVGRNLTFSSFFQMQETIEYRPSEENPNHTLFTQKMQFSVFGFGPLGVKLESAARDSAEKKSHQGLEVMEKVIDRLKASDWRAKANEWRVEMQKLAGDVIPDRIKIESEELKRKATEAETKLNADIMSSISLHPDDN
jgi:hypothetical protein